MKAMLIAAVTAMAPTGAASAAVTVPAKATTEIGTYGIAFVRHKPDTNNVRSPKLTIPCPFSCRDPRQS